jgi:hypothetical protein
MILSFEEILEKLPSSDSEVLSFCRNHMLDLSVEERARNTRAEDKAQTILNICGVGATLLAGFASLALSQSSNLPQPAFLIPFLGPVVFLARSAFFCLKALRPAKDFQFNEELVFDIQEKTSIEFLKYDIAVRVWLYERTLQFNTSKLFYLHRAIRNFSAFIIILLLVSLALFALAGSHRPMGVWITVMFALLPLLAFCVDPLVEKLGGIWVKRSSKKSTGN